LPIVGGFLYAPVYKIGAYESNLYKMIPEAFSGIKKILI
jgi:hypothetical protein